VQRIGARKTGKDFKFKILNRFSMLGILNRKAKNRSKKVGELVGPGREGPVKNKGVNRIQNASGQRDNNEGAHTTDAGRKKPNHRKRAGGRSKNLRETWEASHLANAPANEKLGWEGLTVHGQGFRLHIAVRTTRAHAHSSKKKVRKDGECRESIGVGGPKNSARNKRARALSHQG